MNEFQNFLRGRFFLSEDDQLRCDKYYLLYWSGEYLSSQIANFGSENMLCHQDTFYKVRYNTPSTELEPTSQYAISFRKPIGEHTGFVIIKPAPRKSTNHRILS